MEKNKDLIYGPEDRPPFLESVFAALQHLFAVDKDGKGIALYHHLDIPWHPKPLITRRWRHPREGRILFGTIGPLAYDKLSQALVVLKWVAIDLALGILVRPEENAVPVPRVQLGLGVDGVILPVGPVSQGLGRLILVVFGISANKGAVSG